MSKPGTKNSKWKGGTHTSYKGYLRIGTRLNRNKYVHRHLMEELLRKPIASGYVFVLSEKSKKGVGVKVKKGDKDNRVSVSNLIPPGMTIHHWDHRKQHNCYGNLQLLQTCIHDFCEREYQRFIRENYDAWLEHWKEEERWD